jgi:hypothetical protein
MRQQHTRCGFRCALVYRPEEAVDLAPAREWDIDF